MDGDTLFVLIVASLILAAIVASVLKARYGAIQKLPQDEAIKTELRRLRDETTSMKERIAVLERIATDDGRLLDRQIERLRGPTSALSAQRSEVE